MTSWNDLVLATTIILSSVVVAGLARFAYNLL
jgi:hypothetical protein